jgi:hypothetical protein
MPQNYGKQWLEIIRGELWWQWYGGPKGWPDFVKARIPSQAKINKAVGPVNATVPPTNARINHGIWIADCPNCIGAEAVDYDNRRFFCFNCKNDYADERPIRVIFPPKKDRLQIQAILMFRPDHRNRNWFPYETIEDLSQENIKHGLNPGYDPPT